MKLELVKYKCANCAHTFEAPQIGSNSYGEFLLHSRSGTVRYLNALQDSTYGEIDNLLAKHEKTTNLSAYERAQILRHIYGEIACDRDSDENPFSLESHIPCPICGSQKMETWEFEDPPKLVEIHFDHVTHIDWNKLSESTKLCRIEQALDSPPGKV